MSPEHSAGRYGVLAQLIHWVTAGILAYSVWLAWGMVDLPLGMEKFARYNLHKSLGLTILTLTVLRLVWRKISPPPALPDGMKDWERRAARTSHALLYAILFVQPTIGILHSWAADFPIVIYGQVSLPNPMSADKSLQDALNVLHRWLGWSLVGLIALHAAAALKHHLIDRDDVLRRMIPGLKVRGG